MTVSRSRDPEHLPPSNAPAAVTTDAADAVALLDDVDAGGSVGGVRAGSRDVIRLSSRAQALLRAGLAVRAFMCDAIANAYRTLRLGSRTIVLEFGVYR